MVDNIERVRAVEPWFDLAWLGFRSIGFYTRLLLASVPQLIRTVQDLGFLRASVSKPKAVPGLGSAEKWRSAMTTVVATHAVGNMDTWLGGGDERRALFANFSSNYRIFKHADLKHLVSIVWENADLKKMQAMLSSAEGKAAEAAHTVIDPIEIYIEVEGGK